MAGLLIVTSTPGIRAPLLSVALPVIAPVWFCENAGHAMTKSRMGTTSQCSLPLSKFMEPPNQLGKETSTNSALYKKQKRRPRSPRCAFAYLNRLWIRRRSYSCVRLRVSTLENRESSTTVDGTWEVATGQLGFATA